MSFQNTIAILLVLLVFSISATEIFSTLQSSSGTVPNNHPNNPPPIIIHLIPHSHDDVGWLKTIDDYYYGDDQANYPAGVQYTIDSVVTELDQNPQYKFSIVEIAFLDRWWRNSNKTHKAKLQKLAKNGQIEFVNAGWSMNDEANPYYEDIIDQMTIGLRWVKENLGVVPEVGWHLDPFGHQSSQAALFSQMGFNSLFFARIDRQDKEFRLVRKALQMVWHPKQYSGNDNSIFSHVNYNHYGPPKGFCFDRSCKDEPIRDDPKLDNYNLDRKSQILYQYFKNQSLHYRSRHILHTLGDDYNFENANMVFKNFNKLMRYIHSKPEYNMILRYSTPSEYIRAINAENNTYPTKYDDFFPYEDEPNSFWTGYFVSRVAFKSLIRETGRYTQIIRNHISQLKLSGQSQYIEAHRGEIEEAIWQLEMANGNLQHHDAVAGTARQKVTDNYIVTTCKALQTIKMVYDSVRKQQIQAETGEQIMYINETLWNATQKEWGISIALKQKKSVLLHLFNPGSQGNYTVRVKVSSEVHFKIVADQVIDSNVVCSDSRNKDNCELIMTLPFQEASYRYAKLVPLDSDETMKSYRLQKLSVMIPSIRIGINSECTLKFTRTTQSFDLFLGSENYPFSIDYNFYESFYENGQKSGAYIFRPYTQASQKYTHFKQFYYVEAENTVIFVLEGDKTYTKLYFSRADGFVRRFGFEIETFVDSIDVSDNIGKQIVLNVATSIQNNRTFYTDSNGLEEQRRVIDFRQTWNFSNDEPIAGNYYPISSHIFIKDAAGSNKVTVMTDRAQGATSLKEGNMEIMIHRRITMDDGRGVSEALNQTQPDGKGINQTFRHYILFNSQQHRTLQKRNDQKPVITWSISSTQGLGRISSIRPVFTVPQSVKLYLRPYTDGTYLLRLQNFHETEETAVYTPEEWSIDEYTLGFNQLLRDWKIKKMKWKEEHSKIRVVPEQNNNQRRKPYTKKVEDEKRVIILKPFQIKTFRVRKA